jgi:hypothetical protein
VPNQSQGNATTNVFHITPTVPANNGYTVDVNCTARNLVLVSPGGATRKAYSGWFFNPTSPYIDTKIIEFCGEEPVPVVEPELYPE